jgi:hypothetical protein
MRLRVLLGELALCRLAAGAAVPDPGGAAFWSLTRTARETSLICPAGEAPESAEAVVGGYRALEVEGPMDLALTGVMADLARPLADAGVPIMPVATHDTDYLLVPGVQLGAAVSALRAAGHAVSENAQPE